ncbi:MAG: hypothetical protein IJN72_02685 [Firmicutes bacterium]|nr:hypothetical protein [Bacillota bacterium]
MIQTANGEIEIKKDYKKVIMYALAFLLALGAFLVIHRLGDVTKFVEGTEVVYEGVVSDRAYDLTDWNSPARIFAESREYLGLSLVNSDLDGICIWAASDKAPDRSKYGFPREVEIGDHVIVTAAEEVGTGLLVVQEVIQAPD